MPPNYQSLLYPNVGAGTALPQQTVLPAELAHGTGGNAADYMSKAVGGGRRHRRRNHRGTIVRRSHRKRAGKGRKTRKLRRRRA